jgi:hypothetical protein
VTNADYGTAVYGESVYGGNPYEPPPTNEPPAPPGPGARFHLAIAASPELSGARVGSARVGSALVADSLGRTWVDITGSLDAEAVHSIRRSVSRQAGVGAKYEGGTLSARLHNGDHYAFDPLNTLSPFWAGGTRGSNIRPGVPTRAWLEVAGRKVRLFTGWADDWVHEFTDSWGEVQLTALDGKERLVNVDLPALEEPVGDGDYAAQRIARVLDRAGWPTGLRDLQAREQQMGPTRFEDKAWDEIADVAIADMGLAWVDRHGRVAVRSRASLPRTPRLRFGPDGDVNYRKLKLVDGKTRVVNHAKVSRRPFFDGDEPIETNIYAPGVVDPDLGRRSWSATDLWCRDEKAVKRVGSWAVSQYGLLYPDVDKVTFEWNDDLDPALLEQLASVDIGDRHTVQVKRSDGTSFDRDVLITGVEWRVMSITSFEVSFTTGLPPLQRGNARVGSARVGTARVQNF